MTLTWEHAHGIARKFSCLKGDYPVSADGIDAVAEVIMDVCRSQEEADWLKRQLINHMGTWPGTRVMRELVTNQFRPSGPLAPLPAIESTREAVCPTCNGWGMVRNERGSFHSCSCEDGENVRLNAPSLLDVANGKPRSGLRRAMASPSLLLRVASADTRSAEDELKRRKEVRERAYRLAHPDMELDPETGEEFYVREEVQ